MQVDPTTPRYAPTGVLEAIKSGESTLPGAVGSPTCPIDGLYYLSNRRAFHYGNRTTPIGKVGRHYVTLLHYAIYWERVSTVAALVSDGAPLEAEDGWGQDCLTVAQVCPNLEIRALIEAAAAADVCARRSSSSSSSSIVSRRSA